MVAVAYPVALLEPKGNEYHPYSPGNSATEKPKDAINERFVYFQDPHPLQKDTTMWKSFFADIASYILMAVSKV